MIIVIKGFLFSKPVLLRVTGGSERVPVCTDRHEAGHIFQHTHRQHIHMGQLEFPVHLSCLWAETRAHTGMWARFIYF